MNNKSILEEKEFLKKIQKFAILLTFFGLSRHKHKSFIEFYQIINLYRDIDFSLKLLIFYVYLIFNDNKNIFMNDLYQALNLCDLRINKIFIEYTINKLVNTKWTLKEEDQKNLIESLKIKDFLVIGDKDFEQKIKNIEKSIEINSIKYLQIDEVSNYIINKNNIDSNKKEIDGRITFLYYIIIKVEKYNQIYDKIMLLSAELGLSFIMIIYIEKEDKILFNKNLLKNYCIPLILVYSTEDIINYLSEKIKFNPMDNIKEILESDPELIDFLNIKIPKINFDENNNEDYQDGCFELAETFDINLVKNKIIYIYNDNLLDMTSICYNIYMTYSENNALNFFYKYNGKYFGFTIEPEFITFEISAIKRILYMYCREEIESKKSFFICLIMI